jgi:hypothetical protein
MADGSYAQEKLYEAVLILARGRAPLPQRLRDAYLPALSSIRPLISAVNALRHPECSSGRPPSRRVGGQAR